MKAMKAPKTVTKYNPGDVCFAKVRGFPAWPAKVVALAEENAAKQFRYHVVFFGTNERGLMKGDEMMDYLSNKDKLVKSTKRKGFLAGIAEIEAYLEQKSLGNISDNDQEAEYGDTVAETSNVNEEAEEPKDDARETTDDETALVIDENRAEENKKKVAAIKKRALASRKKPASDVDTPSPVASKRSRTTPAVVSTPTEASLTSRSGRKIKPKKFSDDLDAEVEDSSRTKKLIPGPTYSNPNIIDYYQFDELSAPNYTEEDDSEGMPIRDCSSGIEWPGRVILAKTPSGQLCKIKVDLLRPATFPDEEARLRWDEAVARNARKLKMQLKEGSLTIEQYLANTKRIMQHQAAKLEESHDKRKGKFKLVKWLKIECRMVEIDMNIRMSLTLNAAKVDECLPLLDELAAMAVDPLMLKKHPLVVETVKKLRRYVGNLECWQLNDEEQLEFKQKAHQVRMKAEYIYNKMKSLFVVPPQRGFWDVFTESVKAFMDKTRDLDIDLVYKITDESTLCPTARCEEVPVADKDEVDSASHEADQNNGVESESDEELENRPPTN